MPAQPFYLQDAHSRPAVLGYGEGSSNPIPGRTSPTPLPLTEANLTALLGGGRDDLMQQHERRRGSVAMLKKVGKAMVKPVTTPGKSIMRLKYRCGEWLWDGRAKKRRKKAADAQPLPLFRAPPSTPSPVHSELGRKYTAIVPSASSEEQTTQPSLSDVSSQPPEEPRHLDQPAPRLELELLHRMS